MPSFRTELPPLASLIAFEAAGRHLNLTHAGAELNVSQAAVSKQIQNLERHLGLLLFNREHRGLKLTNEGRRFHESVTMGLSHIANKAKELSMGSKTADITISCSVTFASFWLLARIADYRKEYPETDIKLLATAKMRDFGTKGIDFAVRYGKGNWDNVEADQLFENQVFPVCSPAYFIKNGPIENIKELAQSTLLHLTQYDRNWVSWEAWFSFFSKRPPNFSHDLQFDSYTVLINAALRGDGLALCSSILAEDFLARGELLRPLPAKLPSEYSFYLLRPAEYVLGASAKKFHSWLLRKASEQKREPEAI